jgi:hypothetical protein
MNLTPPQINKKFLEEFRNSFKEDPFVSSTFPFDNYIEVKIF